MAERLTGVFYLYQTHFFYLGALIASSRHQHHAGQVLWAPDGLVVDDEEGRRQVSLYVVPPNRPHGHAAAAAAAVLWVDRDDLRWDPAALESSRGRAEGLQATIGGRLGEPLGPERAREVAQALLGVVAPANGEQEYAPRHPAVVRMCALLASTASERDIPLSLLAKQSGLSMRQLRHRFSDELGLNPRAYLRWRRLRGAFASIGRGATLTEAAIAGGFADGAHFSRAFQAHFGMAPSRALSSVEFGGALS